MGKHEGKTNRGRCTYNFSTSMLEPFLELGIGCIEGIVNFGNDVLDMGLKFGKERHEGMVKREWVT